MSSIRKAVYWPGFWMSAAAYEAQPLCQRAAESLLEQEVAELIAPLVTGVAWGMSMDSLGLEQDSP
jgi:hypothetical protein